MALEIIRIINRPIDSNCYIIFDESINNECVIIDPGSEKIDNLINLINELSLNPRFIILTHEHYDHCWGVNDLRAKFPHIKLICSSYCSSAIQNTKLTYSHYYCKPEFTIKPADIIVEDVEGKISWNDYLITCSQAKGHSLSSIFIFIRSAIFTGDTLIMNSKTITRFKTGSKSDLENTLQKMLSYKGKGFLVHPGHGEISVLDVYDLSNAVK